MNIRNGVSKNLEERAIAEAYEKARREEAAFFSTGYDEGYSRGEEDFKLKVIKNMLNKGCSIDLILDCIYESVDNIRKLLI